MKLTEIRKDILEHNPELTQILTVWGDFPIGDYYAKGIHGTSVPSVDILSTIHTETKELLGGGVASRAKEAIEKDGWVNTADHHGLLFHPYFFPSALIRSNPKINTSRCTVTLPFGGISLSNDSFPRGFALHDAVGVLRRIIFKSLQEKHLPVYALDPITQDVLKREQQRISKIVFPLRTRDRLDALFFEFQKDERVWNQTTYSAQLTVMNSILWKVLFEETRGDFVYLEIETVVRNVLLNKHLARETSIYNLIFNPNWRESFINLFSGVFGSHNPNGGSHLFWFIDHKKGRREGLRIVGNTLVTKDGQVSIELVPENITHLLKARVLMPTTALTLITLSGVEGLTCGGGLSQVHYLPNILRQWKALLTQYGLPTHTIPSDIILSGDGTPFRFGEGETAPLAMLFDLIVNTKDIDEVIQHTIENVTLNEAIDALLPAFYAKKHHLSLPFLYEQTS